MVKRLLNIVLSGWLAVLLLFGTTAKEYIHLFTHHIDTVHTELHRDHVVIENEHHHCTFLNFTIADFINDVPSIFFAFNKPMFAVHVSPAYTKLLSYTVSIRCLRGPPALAC